MTSRSVFVLGATGYVGGTVLATSWVKRHPDFNYTTLVRNPKDVPAVQALGSNVKTVMGSHSDLELIEQHSRENDVVANFADCDDFPLTEAILKGLTDRAKSGTATFKPILIHTSGSGLVVDTPNGYFNDNTTIYDDNIIDSIKSIPDSAMHRNVDNAIFAASEAGAIDAYIIAPSTIYGKGSGPVRITSMQVSDLIRAALRRREFVQIGAGTNRWDDVHVDELTGLYDLVFDLALSGENLNKSYANFFWGSARTHVWGDVINKLAKLMYKRGLVTSEKVKSVTLEEELSIIHTAHNSRTVANRSFALGWKPDGTRLITDEDVLEQEIDLIVAQK